MQFRYQALLALKKNDESLQAAKSYFNVVEMRSTARGIDALTTALVRAKPDDPEIARKFRAEQAAAAQAGEWLFRRLEFCGASKLIKRNMKFS